MWYHIASQKFQSFYGGVVKCCGLFFAILEHRDVGGSIAYMELQNQALCTPPVAPAILHYVLKTERASRLNPSSS